MHGSIHRPGLHPGLFAGLLLLLGSFMAAWLGEKVQAAPAQAPSQDNVVISELRTRGTSLGNEAQDDFVEIFNPTDHEIEITNWAIESVTSSGFHKKQVQFIGWTVISPGQHYLIAGVYYSGSVPPDMWFSSGGIPDTGGAALVDQDGIIIDLVGASPPAAEGTPLAPLSENLDQSYERLPGGLEGSCYDSDDNAADFTLRSPSDPQNSTGTSRTICAAPKTATPTDTGSSTPTETLTSTDPFLPEDTPTSTETPTALASESPTRTDTPTRTHTFTRTLTFTPTGTETRTPSSTRTPSLTRTPSSTRTPSLTKTSTYTLDPRTRTRTPTRVHTVVPGFAAINEFLPQPNRDWNQDGKIDLNDEYIELINLGGSSISLKSWTLENGSGSDVYILPNVSLSPHQILVVFRFETYISLDDSGGIVRLVKPDGQTADTFAYPPVNGMDRTWCLLPGGGGALRFACFPTPGQPNLGYAGTSAAQAERLGCNLPDTVPQALAVAECEGPGGGIFHPPLNQPLFLLKQGKWDVFVE